MKIDAKTRLCAVIGDPVEHSLSPLLHNEAFKERRCNICYTAFGVKDLPGAVAGVRALNLLGLSVTIPHKVSILPLLDEVDETARRIGSVNTVLNKDGTLIGYNSDGMGALRALREAGIDPRNSCIVILGSGGAARAIAFTLGKEASLRELVLLGIDMDECTSLGEELRSAFAFPVRWDSLSGDTRTQTIREADGIIHCTPVGMSPNSGESLLEGKELRPNQFVFDIVYNPLKTKLLGDAEAAGCTVIPGVEMFLHQAVFQFELWTGEAAPVETMRNIVLGALA